MFKFSFSRSWRQKSGIFPDHIGTLIRIRIKSRIPDLCVSTGLELKKVTTELSKRIDIELCCCSLKLRIIDHRSLSITIWQRPLRVLHQMAYRLMRLGVLIWISQYLAWQSMRLVCVFLFFQLQYTSPRLLKSCLATFARSCGRFCCGTGKVVPIPFFGHLDDFVQLLLSKLLWLATTSGKKG